MPCNGIAVLTAQVTVNLEQHFTEPQHRAAFARWLQAQGVDVRAWWPAGTPRRPLYALGIGSDWTGLKFVGCAIQLSDEGDYAAHQVEVDRAFAFAQVYAGQLAQTQVVQALAGLGLEPRNLRQENGMLDCTISAGIEITVRVYPTGQIELITQEGDFESGKTTLEALNNALGASGLSVQQTGQVETHRHDVQLTTTGEHNATVYIHSAVSEGSGHTH